MRYPASEKLEIIRLVEKSHLSVRRTLDKLGIARATFYRWYDLYRLGCENAPEIDPIPKPIQAIDFVWKNEQLKSCVSHPKVTLQIKLKPKHNQSEASDLRWGQCWALTHF